MAPPWVKGTKVCLGAGGGGLVHVTKMAAMLIYGKYLGLVCRIGDLGPTKFVQMMTLTFFYGKVKFASLCFYMGKYRFLQEKCKKVI